MVKINKSIIGKDLLDESDLEKGSNVANDISQGIINALMDDKNLDLKTEIPNPLVFSVYTVVGEYFIDLGYDEPGKSILDFLDKFKRFMISNKRKSRKEILQIYQATIEKMNTSISAKFFSDFREKSK